MYILKDGSKIFENVFLDENVWKERIVKEINEEYLTNYCIDDLIFKIVNTYESFGDLYGCIKVIIT